MAESSCRGGKFVSCDQLSLLGTVRLSDSDTLLLSRAVGPDSVQIGVRLPFCSVRSGFSHGAGAVSYMLLEPSALVGCGSQSRLRDYAVGDTIPVMACTAGIPKTAEYGGQKLEHFDFRSLHDDPVHPRGWYDKYGIRHCVRREVRLAD